MRRTAFLTLIVALIIAAPAVAQTTTGGITGVVRDSAGGVMPGVAVRATHEATNGVTAAVTDSAGLYVLRHCPSAATRWWRSSPVSRHRGTPTSSSV